MRGNFLALARASGSEVERLLQRALSTVVEAGTDQPPSDRPRPALLFDPTVFANVRGDIGYNVRRPNKPLQDIKAPGARVGHAANRILFPPTLSEYNRALHSLGAKKRGHLMMQVLGDMKGDGIAPDQETYRLIIETCAQTSRLPDALRALDEMVARGMRLDLQAYETLIMGLGFDGNLDSAIKYVDKCKDYTGREATAGVYLGAFVCAAQKGKWVVSESLFADMKAKGVAYNDLILREHIKAYVGGATASDKKRGPMRLYFKMRDLLALSTEAPKIFQAKQAVPPTARGRLGAGTDVPSLLCFNALLSVLDQWGWNRNARVEFVRLKCCELQPNLTTFEHVAGAFLTKAGSAPVDQSLWTKVMATEGLDVESAKSLLDVVAKVMSAQAEASGVPVPTPETPDSEEEESVDDEEAGEAAAPAAFDWTIQKKKEAVLLLLGAEQVIAEAEAAGLVVPWVTVERVLRTITAAMRKGGPREILEPRLRRNFHTLAALPQLRLTRETASTLMYSLSRPDYASDLSLAHELFDLIVRRRCRVDFKALTNYRTAIRAREPENTKRLREVDELFGALGGEVPQPGMGRNAGSSKGFSAGGGTQGSSRTSGERDREGDGRERRGGGRREGGRERRPAAGDGGPSAAARESEAQAEVGTAAADSTRRD